MKFLIAILVSLSIILVLGACSDETPAETTSLFDPPEEITEENTDVFAVNGKNGVMYSKLLNGSLEESQQATVLTDESCQMDNNGITHCFNNIRLANGEEIRVNTLHVMNEVPCLKPEEKVNVTSHPNGYVKITRDL